MPKLVRKAPVREEQLAVNLDDLARVDPAVRAGIASKLDPINPVRIEAETAVPFLCDLLAAACLVDVLRSHDREAGDYPTRAYLKRRSGGPWAKLPGQAILASTVADGVVLNPDLFSTRVNPADLVAPPVMSVMM